MRRSTKRLLLWAPVVLAGMLLYWTVALGAAGMSLLSLETMSGGGVDIDTDDVEQPPESLLPGEQPMEVRLQEEATTPLQALTPSVVEPAPMEMLR